MVYVATLGLDEQTFLWNWLKLQQDQKLKWRKTPSQLSHLRSYIFWVLLFVISELKLFPFSLFEPLTNSIILGVPNSNKSHSRFYNFLLYQANLYIHGTRLNIFLPPERDIHHESALKFLLHRRGNRYVFVYIHTKIDNEIYISYFFISLILVLKCDDCYQKWNTGFYF